MSKSPTAVVKEKFGEKAKLVAALAPFTGDEGLWVKRVNETKGLERVSSAKLLRLYRVFSAVKEKFGSRSKLVDAICELEKRSKDEGYKSRLGAYAVPRLYDLYVATARRAGVKVAPLPGLLGGGAGTAPKAALAEKAEKAPAKTKPAHAKASASTAKAASKPKAAAPKSAAKRSGAKKAR
jgi:hypothetical protein